MSPRSSSPLLRWARLLRAPAIVCIALACTNRPDGQTLAALRDRAPDLEEARVDHGIEQAMEGYRKFLEDAPTSSLTPEAMRRLADLELEKEFGRLDSNSAPARAATRHPKSGVDPSLPGPASLATPAESKLEFEQRTLHANSPVYVAADSPLDHPIADEALDKGPLEAIALYDQILERYPDYAHSDQVLYQKARAFEELGRIDDAMAVTAILVERHPESRHLDEIQFRRGEYFFTRKNFIAAESAFAAIVAHGMASEYYELALYKLGWTFYKEMLLEEALATFIRLLDYEVATGVDFDKVDDEALAQRIDDTYRVTSLCFSDLGGAEAVVRFFDQEGTRSYEDRVYRQLGEFYLEKLRYHDAATVLETFVDLHPHHRRAPHFSMRVVEIYEAGQFPRLVLEAKKSFAADYGLRSEYWRHFDIQEASDVRAYLKRNIRDLANHHHALYQSTDRPEDRPGHLDESTHWYREYLESFPTEPETPAVHYRLADLLLEGESFGEAAREYEHIAYDYGPHEHSAEAGYAAVFARRRLLERASDSEADATRREVVASSLRFVDLFPSHEDASTVLAAAVDDLYVLKEHPAAIANAHRLIDVYPDVSPSILRGAWTVIAHASFDSASYAPAEQAYARVLELTPADDDSRRGITDNLAASIYKLAEEANAQANPRMAADHFLRIAKVAPDSEIRPLAEYDAAAALVTVQDWAGASAVLESFRTTHPEHALNREATQQLAFIYRESGDLSRAASEYERVARESNDTELSRSSLLLAGDLHQQAGDLRSALAVYGSFVTSFTRPIELAVVTRFKMAEIYRQLGNEDERLSEYERIVSIDANAGEERTQTVRSLASRSALHLAQAAFDAYARIELVLPFDASLRQKQQSMQTTLATFENLIDYGQGDVTAAATYYMAEIYGEFSRALLESERPGDLDAAALADYEDVLEQEAFPFEEEAIAIHRKNLELMSSRLFNEWIEKSLAALAVSMPGRYAKFEISTGPLDSIDTYAYQTPTRPAATLALSPEAGQTPSSELEAGASDVPVDESMPAALATPTGYEGDDGGFESATTGERDETPDLQ